MKTRAFLLLALTLAFPALTPAAQPADMAAVPRMALADFKKALDAGQILVLDVRDAQSYANGTCRAPSPSARPISRRRARV